MVQWTRCAKVDWYTASVVYRSYGELYCESGIGVAGRISTGGILTMRKIKTEWTIATYDVWGNADDGYEVNDVYTGCSVILNLTPKTYNIGTPQEFISATPTDAQIRSVFGLGKMRIDTDGDDLTIYVNRECDSCPIGELHCTSHKSLSPIIPT